MNQIELLHLPVRQQVPSLGSHRFTLRTGCRIEEIAISIDDVLYYTLPCIATLAFPEPDKWKKSWETVYRSLMPHRRNIFKDEQRVKSVSELPVSPLPHGNPGPWTEHVVREISRQFKISPDSLPPQLIVQLGICEEGWPLHSQDQTDVSPVPARQEERQEEPLRDPLLVRATSNAT